MRGEWLTDDKITSEDGMLGYFRLQAPLDYRDNHGDVWTTPTDTVSDLSSFPWFIRMVIPTTVLVKSPFQHDHHYKEQPDDPQTKKPITRKRSDQLYRDSAFAEGLDERRAKRFYIGLRAGGWITWRKYRRADKKQSKRNLKNG